MKIAEILKPAEGTVLKLFIDQTITTFRTLIFTLGGSLVTLGFITDAWLQKWGMLTVIALTFAWVAYSNWSAWLKGPALVQAGAEHQAAATNTPVVTELSTPEAVKETLAAKVVNPAPKPTVV